VRYALATPGGSISITNLHLETPRKGFEGLMVRDVQRLRLNTTLRDLESTLARRWVDAAHGPTIVAGDFNTPVESRIFQEHWGDLVDAFSRVGAGLGMTKYNGWIRIRIDHVLADRVWWRPVRARMGDDLGSDHRPLIVDLVLVEH
jgi:vancomycin resistance protein VanJ